MKKSPESKAPDIRRGTAAKRPAKPAGRRVAPVVRQLPGQAKAGRFDEVLSLIAIARQRAYQAVNAELVGLYWELGGYISRKIASAEWGEGVVEELAATIAREYPGQRGFTRPNLFRMRQFFDAYQGDQKVSALLRQLPWTHHLLILGLAKLAEERKFYMAAAIKHRWTSREMERQIRTGSALRSLPTTKKVSPPVTQIHPAALDEFKSAYSLEFLGLVQEHSESDILGALLRKWSEPGCSDLPPRGR